MAWEEMDLPEETRGAWLQAMEAYDFLYKDQHSTADGRNEGKRIALTALETQPCCIEAHNVLALCSDSLDEALLHYQDAVAAAPACLGGSENIDDILSNRSCKSAWMIIPFRPYIRALHGCANTLCKLERYEEALEVYLTLDQVDPTFPHQNAPSYPHWRFHVPLMYLMLGRLDECNQFMVCPEPLPPRA